MAKQSSTGASLAFGGGYILRSAAEFYIVGTIGAPKRISRSVRNCIVAPVREHSRKPEQLHSDIEALYAGPYVELFARTRRLGWDAWGNQVDKFTEISGDAADERGCEVPHLPTIGATPNDGANARRRC